MISAFRQGTARRAVPLLLVLFPALAGCLTEHAQPVARFPAVPDQSVFVVNRIELDEHGRPGYRDKLGSRPGSAGDRFTVVHTVAGRLARTYDIAVVPQAKAGPGPLAVVYEWTGRGFEGGVIIAEGMFPKGTISSRQEAAVYLALKTAPVVIATVTGFVVGVLAVVPETAKELRRVMVNTRETLVSRTEYAYDEKGRIRFMKLFAPPDRTDAVVSTEFSYAGDSGVPARTEVTSAAERNARLVR